MDMKMNELARVGFVVSRQPEKHRVRVVLSLELVLIKILNN